MSDSLATFKDILQMWKAVSDGLTNKVDKIAGKGLSANDFTNEYKTKLETIQAYANYIYTQSTANDTWSISHNLGRYPSVMVADTSGSVAVGTVTYIDSNNLTITFSAPFSGTAYLN